ncbi:MAG: multidrug efflux SMR transporter [Pseudomonadota bacterium]
MAYAFLIGAIIFEVAGTAALKLSDGFTKLWPSSITVIGYGASFYLLSLSLRTLNVGYTYAIWSAVGLILLALIGALFMDETVDLAGILGIGLIAAGVIIMSVYSKMGGH